MSQNVTCTSPQGTFKVTRQLGGPPSAANSSSSREMPHFICRWPGGDVLLASVESRQELDAILQERCEPGVCKVARYHGPLVLELKPDIPGVPRASAERFKLGPACPAFQAAWQTRLSLGDADLLAADGSRQRVHKLVLQCRLPALDGQPLPAHTTQVRLPCVQDSSCLASLVEFLYLDDVQQQAALTAGLHLAALQCGLQRLVTRCEAHFAHQLEVQLLSWPGLVDTQREAVLDSFIGWATHAEQLDRQELLQLCVHALALHYATAQSRPSWSLLSSSTAALVHLVAASTAPPIIHRQVLPNGSAILPMMSNPGPDGHGPSSSAAAAAAGGQQPPASPSVVSADAEAFAAAGGRMTSWEWQQLQRFREAVAESRTVPEASPLMLEAEQLSGNSLTATEPGVSFAVKQAVLTPHRRLMDSVCRFAFPATHGLLAAGWQPQPHSSNLQQQQVPAGNIGAQASPQAGAAFTQAPAQQAGLSTGQAAGQQQHMAQQEQQQQQQHVLQYQQLQQALHMQLPIPVPVLARQPESGQQQQQRMRSDSGHGSCGDTVQTGQPQSHAANAATDSARPSRLGSSCGSLPASGSPLQAAATAGVGSWPAGSHLQLRAQAAAGAAAAQRGSSVTGLPAAHLSGGPSSSEAVQGSWGSALGPGSQQQAHSMQQSQDTQQPPGGQQQQPQGLLAGAVGAAQSWGTGVNSSQQQQQQQPTNDSANSSASLQGPFSTGGAAPCSGAVLQPSQQQLPAAGAASAALTQHIQQDGVVSVTPNRSEAASLECQATAATQQQQQQRQVHQQAWLLEGAGSITAAAAANESEGVNLSWGSCSQAGANQSMICAGVVDLPAVWQPSSRGSRSRRSDPATSSCAAAATAAAADRTAVQAAPAGPEQAAQPAAGQDHQQQQTPALNMRTQEVGAGSGRSSHPDAATAAAGSQTTHAARSLAALQRALVEDFVLYEEASAARQHVVSILVAVEQGDAAAGQRLLAPACAELITATAPAAVPNRLAGHLNTSAVVSAAAAATAAGLPASGVSCAVAVAAAEEYCRATHGIHRLLGSASSSRAALEASPRQLRQQRVQQQQLLMSALQQVSSRVPWLSRLLTPLQQTMGASTAAGGDGAAAGEPGAGGGQPVGQAPPSTPAATAAAQAAAASQDNLAALSPQQQQQQGGTSRLSGSPEAAAAIDAAAAAGQDELKSAVVELIMQLPELLHGLPGPALLTFDQYRQRHTQAQQLAAHAMQLLLPGTTAAAAAAAATTAGDSSSHQGGGGSSAAAVDGIAAELAASGLLAAASAAMAASQAAAPSGDPAGSPGQPHAGHLFANILDSLRLPGGGLGAADGQHMPGSTVAATAAEEAAAAAAGPFGARGAAAAAASAASGFLSRTAAFAAANRLAEGLIRPPTGVPASSLGLSRAGSLVGSGQLGAWRLPVPGAAGGGGGGGAGAAGFLTPGSMAGGLGMGMFVPTGTGALLSGGLLAEGGVAGDSILDDMLHVNVRRITCHGLYELCAALAQPAGAQGGSPTQGSAQQQQQLQQTGLDDGPAAPAVAPATAAAGGGATHMDTDDSSHGGAEAGATTRTRTGQHVAEAVATVAAAAATIESSRRSSISSMGPPSGTSSAGTKRRLSSTLEEQGRAKKH